MKTTPCIALTVLSLLVAFVVGAPSAQAQSPARRTVFALIVTNNRSTRLGRGDLRYADDDGAKYYETLREIAPEENTFLLTEFDRDTEKLFPHLKSKLQTPDRAHVMGAAAKIAERARAARQAGQTVELYFVFAGHGDVDEGRGFLELLDGPFHSDDLTALLKSIPATHSHVILDSCNSFFVINARKPGGRHFATPEDAARTLSESLPNVGVFLSTSAEAEVFEWSELQSGIFSYAVRSGLSGAADANGDGVVSYAELRAFVDIASSQVKNPNYRPQVFARGPGGRDQDALMDLASAQGARLELDAGPSARITVRDADEVPWVDVNKEAGARVTLRLPERWGVHAIVEESESTPEGVRTQKRASLSLTAEASTVALAQLTFAPVPLGARGPGDMFRTLFARPFGPHAYSQFEQDLRNEPPPVYGVSTDDRERMNALLGQVASIEHGDRMVYGTMSLGLAATSAALGGAYLTNAFHEPGPNLALGYVWLGIAAGDLVGATFRFTRPSEGERLYDQFRHRLNDPAQDPARVIGDTEIKLFKLARSYHTARLWTRGSSVALFVVGAGIAALAAADYKSLQWELNGGTVAHRRGRGWRRGDFFASSFVPSSIERMADLWRGDRSLQRIPRVTVTPSFTGSGVGLTGRF